jgi:hypothetical protein
MSLLSYALTTTARAKTYLGSSAADATVESVVNAVTAWIESYCGRRFKQTTYTNELLDSDGSEYLFLSNYPVDETTGVNLDYRTSSSNESEWSDIDTEDRWIDWNTGVITGIGQTKWVKGVAKYRATYLAGFNFDNSATFLSDTGAADLEIAAWKICGAFLNIYPSGTGLVTKEELGQYAVTYSKIAFEDDQTIGAILAKYAKVDSSLGVMGPVLY